MWDAVYDNGKKRKYNDPRERANTLNRTLARGITIYFLIMLIFSAMELKNSIHPILEIFLISASSILMVLTWLFYFKNRYSEKFYIFITCTYFYMYLVAYVASGKEFMQFSIVALLAIDILFYNVKFISVISILAVISNVIHFAFCVKDIFQMQQVSTWNSLSNDAKTEIIHLNFRIVILICILYAVIRASSRAKMFNEDITGTAFDEKDKQKVMLEEVLNIASIIKENTIASNQLVNELGDSTNYVNMTVGQISASTQVTAENIQEQNVMTQTIQVSIHETGKRSKKIVENANESTKSIEENLKIMENLKEDSDQIGVTNQNLLTSMELLQDKTNEVNDIARIINNISEQTNLLSLNATIESARAGEAGKGFAVVANQIHKLSEQTKDATNNIAKLLQELSEYAEAATKSVDDSIQATEHQSVLIQHVSEGFNQINQNVTVLVDDIGGIDSMIESLESANNTIVENISHISATTEEVTASSEEATAISEKNAQDASQAMKLLKEVLDTTARLDKYFTME